MFGPTQHGRLAASLLILAGCQGTRGLDPRALGPPVHAAVPPPAIAGGTLFVLESGLTAVVGDPDRDRVILVDLTAGVVLDELALEAGDEPGRITEGPDGRVHVVLRGAGAVLSVDPLALDAAVRRDACPMPRGIAYDGASGALLIACRGGELVTVPDASDAAATTDVVEHDLRDVILADGRLFVTTFRTAELLELDPTTHREIDRRSATAAFVDGSFFEPGVAWRTIHVPSLGELLMVHQRANAGAISTDVGGYTGDGSSGARSSRPCVSDVVHGALTRFRLEPPLSGARELGATLPTASLPVDVVVSAGTITVVAAGNQAGVRATLSVRPEDVGLSPAILGECTRMRDVTGELGVTSGATSIAAMPDGSLIVLERDPLVLVTPGGRVALGGAEAFDTGHALFHGNASVGAGLACASCHPEGGDDGRTWAFDRGARRTPALAGPLLSTAPFHWNGEHATLSSLLADVLTRRMGGPALDAPHVDALGAWLDTIPAARPTRPATDAAAVRGRALFAGVAGCVECHDGPTLTNDETLDVGTGGAFQVPSLLGVSQRLPVLHDGCAHTLEERFDPECGGAAHGHVSALDAAEIADVVAYLETL